MKNRLKNIQTAVYNGACTVVGIVKNIFISENPQIFGPSTGTDIMHTALVFQPVKKDKQIIPFLLIFCDRSLCLVKVKTLSVYVIS